MATMLIAVLGSTNRQSRQFGGAMPVERRHDPVSEDRATLQCELKLEADNVNNGDFPPATVTLRNISPRTVVIDWKCHVFDHLDVLYYAQNGQLITSFPRYGLMIFTPLSLTDSQLVLQPGDTYSFCLGLRGAFGLDRKYTGKVNIKVVYRYKTIVAESALVSFNLKNE
jgi:hypothetical protein